MDEVQNLSNLKCNKTYIIVGILRNSNISSQKTRSNGLSSTIANYNVRAHLGSSNTGFAGSKAEFLGQDVMYLSGGRLRKEIHYAVFGTASQAAIK
jgi:hypothetical protein